MNNEEKASGNGKNYVSYPKMLVLNQAFSFPEESSNRECMFEIYLRFKSKDF